jgi:hypothetical protein
MKEKQSRVRRAKKIKAASATQLMYSLPCSWRTYRTQQLGAD